MNVRIYVEGGGDQRVTLSACRAGFAEFFGKLVPLGRKPKIIACGSRGATFDDLRIALGKHANAFVVLLVDSEGPLTAGYEPWTHLKARDSWDRPPGVAAESAHLMVQCMEAWLLADRDALATYYDQGFNGGALPGNPNVEQVSRADVMSALDNATRHTRTKGRYHKTRHGFQILATIDPAKVRAASAHANRLCTILLARIGDP